MLLRFAPRDFFRVGNQTLFLLKLKSSGWSLARKLARRCNSTYKRGWERLRETPRNQIELLIMKCINWPLSDWITQRVRLVENLNFNLLVSFFHRGSKQRLQLFEGLGQVKKWPIYLPCYTPNREKSLPFHIISLFRLKKGLWYRRPFNLASKT